HRVLVIRRPRKRLVRDSTKLVSPERQLVVRQTANDTESDATRDRNARPPDFRTTTLKGLRAIAPTTTGSEPGGRADRIPIAQNRRKNHKGSARRNAHCPSGFLSS